MMQQKFLQLEQLHRQLFSFNGSASARTARRQQSQQGLSVLNQKGKLDINGQPYLTRRNMI
jgi:hypothetical protein